MLNNLTRMINALAASGHRRTSGDVRVKSTYKVVVISGNYWLIQNITPTKVMIYKYTAAGDFIDHESQEVTAETWA